MKFDWRNRIEQIYPPTNEEQIQSLESELGLQLPVQFRNFLLTYNGAIFRGMPSFKYTVPASFGGELTRTGELCLICGIDPENVEVEPKSLRCAQEWYGFNEACPPNYLGIGHPPSHGILCISTSGKDQGAVYLWEPGELGTPPEYPTEYLHPIAPSFNEFLECLEIAPDVE